MKSIINLLKNTDIKLSYKNGELQVYLDGIEITDKIRDEKVSQRASQVASIKEVREYMVSLQRRFGEEYKNIVIEGRDTGTVIFPNAELKIFLTASAEVRIQRRYKQLLEKGFNVDYEKFVKDFMEREVRDNTRKVNPLRPAEDSVIVDTGNMSFEEVVNRILSLAKEVM
ncbi:MAG: (d)CMP kinase [Persephonella sp.]|nr:MAG: (d)CMP kinase [Persephonella sp.]